MSPEELELYLHSHIPLSMTMGVGVVSIEEQAVTLSAPLAPNINHRATVFGGSASAVAILCAWSLLHTRLAAAGIASRLVIQRNTMDYLAPIAGDFTAVAQLHPAADWALFHRTIERRGRARIEVDVAVMFDDRVAARLHGTFVALSGDA